MSNEATSWAVRQDPGGSGPKLLLMVLANHAGKDGVTIVGRELLAEECCTRTATVTDNFKRLESCGLVARLERRRGNGSRTSDWTILAPQYPDRGEMIDGLKDRSNDRPVEVLELACRGTDSVGDGGTDSAPDDEGVRYGFGEVQVRKTATSGTDSGETRAVSEPSVNKGDSGSLEPESPTENKPTASLSSRPELVRLSDRMAAGIKQRHSRANVKPQSKAWLDPLRLLIDRDGYSEDEVETMIDWVLADERTSRYVLSPMKLRAQRDELAIKAGVAQPADDGLFKFRTERPKVNRLTQPVDEAPLPAVTPELEAAWAPIMAQIERVVDEPTRKLWLDGLHLHAAGDELVVGCGHGATRWVSERFGRVITAAAELVAGDVPVRIVECGCEPAECAA